MERNWVSLKGDFALLMMMRVLIDRTETDRGEWRFTRSLCRFVSVGNESSVQNDCENDGDGSICLASSVDLPFSLAK
jgi:hypothetical protein